jgi:hypothetical protein
LQLIPAFGGEAAFKSLFAAEVASSLIPSKILRICERNERLAGDPDLGADSDRVCPAVASA